MNEQFLQDKLSERQIHGNLRKLGAQNHLTDFTSNDYLGLARNSELHSRIQERFLTTDYFNGGTGSRLLSGNHKEYYELEQQLKQIFKSESALVFNSGYAANQALISSIASKGDTILYDQLAHVCLKEGAWLSQAESISFKHNDLEDLESKLRRSSGKTFVVTETIFSMDGDVSPITEIVELCEKLEAYLIVDEAHSTGVYGKSGAGFLVERGLEDRIFARVYTFGKAMGVHGACVIGSQLLVDFLINFGRTFIYTTSLPPHSVISIQESFKYLNQNLNLQDELKERIKIFKSNFRFSISDTAIQPIIVGSNQKAKMLSKELNEEGFDVRPILSPTVKKGLERVRICLHIHNSPDEVMKLASLTNTLL